MTANGTSESIERRHAPRLPPRWFIRAVWVLHRALYSGTRGRFGLRSATADGAGMLQLTTVGRRTGKERRSIVAYLEDGADLVTLAMNGWADGPPAWWLNLQADPDAGVQLPAGSRAVRARAANPEERLRLWPRFARGPWGDVDGFAAKRSRETPIVILEPRQ
jgi:deazaflavin-dependent oxidoreductase (nitroreductase family)